MESKDTNELAEQAVEKLDEAKATVQRQLKDQFDRRAADVGDQAFSVATALRHSAEDLSSEGKQTPARVIEEVSDRVERVGGYLTSGDSTDMLRDLEDFVYRRPLLVVAGAATLGFVAARFLGASSRRRHEDGAAYRPQPVSVSAIQREGGTRPLAVATPSSGPTPLAAPEGGRTYGLSGT